MHLKILIITIIISLVNSKTIKFSDGEKIEEYINKIKNTIGTEKQFVVRNGNYL